MIDIDPTSPESMRRTASGESGLSAIREKPEDDRSVFQQTRDYLTKGINKDARYVLGEHAAPAITGLGSLLGELFGPGADVRDALVESQRTAEAASEGKALEAGIGGLSTLASLAAIFMPGSLSGVKKASALRKIFDKLPEEKVSGFPKQPDSTGLYGYHGSAKGRLSKKGEEYFDMSLVNPNDQFMGEGIYLSINPKTAEGYANLRANKDFNQKMPDSFSKDRKLGEGAFRNPDTGQIATTSGIEKGLDIEGNSLLFKGQNISRFDLSGIQKPFIVKNNKDRLYAKKNIEKLKEEGYDSIIFRNFEDRSEQILIFPEHVNKISPRKGGGSVMERNPYNYEPRAV